MNFVEIAGHLGADAEERFTPSGKKVISLRMATKVRQGGKDETVWWRVSIWGDRFDKMVPYLRKGTGLIIFGEMMKPEIYTDKMGNPQISLSMSAEVVRFSPFGKGAKEGEGDRSSGSGFMQQDRQEQQRQKSSQGFEQEEVGALVSGDDSGFTGDDLPF